MKPSIGQNIIICGSAGAITGISADGFAVTLYKDHEPMVLTSLHNYNYIEVDSKTRHRYWLYKQYYSWACSLQWGTRSVDLVVQAKDLKKARSMCIQKLSQMTNPDNIDLARFTFAVKTFKTKQLIAKYAGLTDYNESCITVRLGA